MAMKFIAFISLIAFGFGLNAQVEQSILMRGGQIINGIQLDQSPEEIVMETTKKNGKIKIVLVDKSRIFSITENGLEEIWYDPDSSLTGYSIEEMRYYIKGQQDGRIVHKTTISWIVSIGVSGGLAAFLGTKQSSLLFLAPIPGTLLGSAVTGNLPPDELATGEEPACHAAYIAGYKQSARMKKIIHSIAGSLVGTAVGSLIGLGIASSDS